MCAQAVGMTRAAAPAGPFSRLLSYLRGLFGLGANAALPGPSQQVRFTARLRSMSSASAASTVAFTFAAPPSLQGPSSGVLQGGLGGKQATPLASLALQFTMPLPCAALTWGGVDACGLIAAIPRPPSGDTSIQFTTAAAASSAGGARLGADGLLEVAGVGPLVPFVSLLQLGSQGSTLDGLPPAELVSRVASFVRSERPSAQVAGIEGGASQFAATRRLLDVSWDEGGCPWPGSGGLLVGAACWPRVVIGGSRHCMLAHAHPMMRPTPGPQPHLHPPLRRWDALQPATR